MTMIGTSLIEFVSIRILLILQQMHLLCILLIFQLIYFNMHRVNIDRNDINDYAHYDRKVIIEQLTLKINCDSLFYWGIILFSEKYKI